ncbi:SDR family oxidoreductase [Burkholderia gladioli]|uniref:SDR family oxidoreductase n=1 Tax=Burkholderia gladioli TaxID=28095 RepID=UPI00163EB03E|nr:SDR family oxidoreductase [Burkholderia gladioli]MDN7598308.1 SDR family oxidoreductase [Burkholderia gladioli]
MDLEIAGKVALVLGAAGGLGSAIARRLALEGATVALADLDDTALAAHAAELARLGVNCRPYRIDLADLDALDGHLDTIERELGPVEILVNNTGGPPPSPASGVASSTWAAHFQSMVLSVIRITDRVLPGMRERGWGRIVTSASSGVIAPIPNLGVSNALRLSLVGWSKTLAREVAAHGITVNVVVPGRIATARIRFLDESKAKRENRPLEDVVRESVASIPAARYGEPEEYADVVSFLASRRASYVTGSVIRIDGGYIQSV